MKNRIAGLAGALLALALPMAAAAEDYLRPINLPKGSVINFSVTRSGTKTLDGKTTGEGVAITFRYRQTVDPAPGGYRVKITVVGVDLPAGMNAEEQASARQAAQVTSGMEFLADSDLYPMELVGWQAQVDRIIGVLAAAMKAPADDPALVATRNIYRQMSAQEAAASLLQDWALPTSPQNLAFDIGKPVKYDNEVEGPGGVKLKLSEVMELKSIDRAAGRAIVEFHQGFDPDSASALLRATIAMLTAAIPAEARPPAQDLSGLKMEQSTDCRYEMDLRTGLAAKTDCTKTVSAVDEALKPQRRVDRWVITQDVAQP